MSEDNNWYTENSGGDWPEWSKVWDPASNSHYFYNNYTGLSQWEKPEGFVDDSVTKKSTTELYPPHLRAVLKIQSTYRARCARKEIRIVRAKATAKLDRNAGKLWIEVGDPIENTVFYFNTKTEELQWEEPLGEEEAKNSKPMTLKSSETRRIETGEASKDNLEGTEDSSVSLKPRSDETSKEGESNKDSLEDTPGGVQIENETPSEHHKDHESNEDKVRSVENIDEETTKASDAPDGVENEIGSSNEKQSVPKDGDIETTSTASNHGATVLSDANVPNSKKRPESTPSSQEKENYSNLEGISDEAENESNVARSTKNEKDDSSAPMESGGEEAIEKADQDNGVIGDLKGANDKAIDAKPEEGTPSNEKLSTDSDEPNEKDVELKESPEINVDEKPPDASVSKEIDLIQSDVNDDMKKHDDANNEMKKPDDANDEMKKPDDANDEMKKPGDANDEMKKSGDANDEMKKPGDANDEMKKPDDANDEVKKPDDANDEMKKPDDANDEVKKPDDANDEMKKPGDANDEMKKPSNIQELKEPDDDDKLKETEPDGLNQPKEEELVAEAKEEVKPRNLEWEAGYDPTTNTTYYRNKVSGETQFELPAGVEESDTKEKSKEMLAASQVQSLFRGRETRKKVQHRFKLYEKSKASWYMARIQIREARHLPRKTKSVIACVSSAEIPVNESSAKTHESSGGNPVWHNQKFSFGTSARGARASDVLVAELVSAKGRPIGTARVPLDQLFEDLFSSEETGGTDTVSSTGWFPLRFDTKKSKAGKFLRLSKDVETVGDLQVGVQLIRGDLAELIWIEMYDPQSKKHYYYNRDTGEATFEKPEDFKPGGQDDLLLAALRIQCAYRSKMSRNITYKKRKQKEWIRSFDGKTNRFYYYHTPDGQVHWEEPFDFVPGGHHPVMDAAVVIQCLGRSCQARKLHAARRKQALGKGKQLDKEMKILSFLQMNWELNLRRLGQVQAHLALLSKSNHLANQKSGFDLSRIGTLRGESKAGAGNTAIGEVIFPADFRLSVVAQAQQLVENAKGKLKDALDQMQQVVREVIECRGSGRAEKPARLLSEKSNEITNDLEEIAMTILSCTRDDVEKVTEHPVCRAALVNPRAYPSFKRVADVRVIKSVIQDTERLLDSTVVQFRNYQGLGVAKPGPGMPAPPPPQARVADWVLVEPKPFGPERGLFPRYSKLQSLRSSIDDSVGQQRARLGTGEESWLRPAEVLRADVDKRFAYEHQNELWSLPRVLSSLQETVKISSRIIEVMFKEQSRRACEKESFQMTREDAWMRNFVHYQKLQEKKAKEAAEFHKVCRSHWREGYDLRMEDLRLVEEEERKSNADRVLQRRKTQRLRDQARRAQEGKRDREVFSPWEACRAGSSLRCFKRLLDDERDRRKFQESRSFAISDTEPETGETLLHTAAWFGRVEIVQHLLKREGAFVNQVSSVVDQTTPLHMATRGGNVETIHLLISSGAKLDAQDGSGDTALHWASRHGSIQVVRALLSYGSLEGAPTTYVTFRKGKGSSTPFWNMVATRNQRGKLASEVQKEKTPIRDCLERYERKVTPSKEELQDLKLKKHRNKKAKRDKKGVGMAIRHLGPVSNLNAQRQKRRQEILEEMSKTAIASTVSQTKPMGKSAQRNSSVMLPWSK